MSYNPGHLPSHPSLPMKPDTGAQNSRFPPSATASTSTSTQNAMPTASGPTYSLATTPSPAHLPLPMHMRPAMPAGSYNPQMTFMQPALQTAYQWDPTAALKQALFQTPSYNYQVSAFDSQTVSHTHQAQTPSCNTPENDHKLNHNRPAPSSSSTSSSNLPPAKKPRIQTNSGNESQKGHWRNCQQSGCSFVGLDKDVAIHEEDRHLIHKPGKKSNRSEEEERAMKKGGPPPPVYGTGITLQTPEQIEAWIAQRKARWPTAARVAEKETERQEKIARGELDVSKQDRRNRDRDRNSGRGRGRGRGGGESEGRGRGRGGRTGGRDERKSGPYDRTSSQQQQFQTPDTGYSNQKTRPPAVEKGKKANKVLGLVAYDSDSDDKNEDESSGSSSDSDSSSSEDSDSEEESQPGIPAPTPQDQPQQREEQQRTPGGKIVCRFFARTGRCRNGRKCHFAHVQSEDNARPSQQNSRQNNRQEPKPTVSFQRPSLLGALLDAPIAQTLSHLSQAIHFLVDNDFLEDVELEVGQAEEVERLRHLVKEIPSSDPVIDDVKDREVEQDTSHVEVAAEAEAETEEKGGGEYSAS